MSSFPNWSIDGEQLVEKLDKNAQGLDDNIKEKTLIINLKVELRNKHKE